MRFNTVAFTAAALAALAVGAGAQTDAAQVAEVEELPSLPAGDSISLNVSDVDITAVLRLLCDARQINIIAGPEVSGTVSVNLYDVLRQVQKRLI